ncbi:hypothetical protein [Vibrio sp. 16]|uniref:hypothetical protein n=1 Tax=Vibrio sp. 16 TaxID=391586 RepID=UPI00018F1DE3|nr:hypothetical protein [Vibrio sp. 16]EED25370.1 hypothetical protein VPMS16_2740 [Vibrio sp. 16]CAK4076554.1 hypothetical protein PVDT1_35 [Vibrio sp. 16]
MIHNDNVVIRSTAIFFLAVVQFFLVGCQETEKGTSGQGQGSASLQLQPVLVNVSDNQGFIDLTPYISSDSERELDYRLDVLAVSDLDQVCLVNSINRRGFYFVKHQDVCIYQYTVTATNADGDIVQRKSQARVLTSTQEEFEVTPLSHELVRGLQSEMVLPIEPGFVLDSIVSVQGGVQATALANGNINIDASLASQSGLAVIDYKIRTVDTSAQANRFNQRINKPAIRLGQIYVTVQDPGYVSVDAGSGHLPKDGSRKEYFLDEEVIVDVSSFVQAGTFDYQLFEVKSSTANVEVISGSDQNKSFRFSASQPGRHYVYYMVYDNTTSGGSAGGYSGNVLTFDVAIPRYWEKIVLDNHRVFSAPETYAESEGYNFSLFGISIGKHYDTSVEKDMLTMSLEDASTYCDFFGRTPRLVHLQQLLEGDLNLVEKAGWPTDKPYLYLKVPEFTYHALDMKTGLKTDEVNEVYSSCAQTVLFEYVGSTEAVADGKDQVVLTFNVKETYPFGQTRTAKGVPLSASVRNGNAQFYGGELGKTKYSNHKGELSFYFTSQMAGESTISFVNHNLGGRPKDVVIRFSAP